MELVHCQWIDVKLTPRERKKIEKLVGGKVLEDAKLEVKVIQGEK